MNNKTFLSAMLATVFLLVGFGCQQGPPKHEILKAELSELEATLSPEEWEELQHDLAHYPTRDLRQRMADGSVYTLDRFSHDLMKESERLRLQISGVVTDHNRLELYQMADSDGDFHISRSEARKLRDWIRAVAAESRIVHRKIRGQVFSMDISAASKMEQAEEVVHKEVTRRFRAEQDAWRNTDPKTRPALVQVRLRERDRRTVLEEYTLVLFIDADADGDFHISKEEAKDFLREVHEWFRENAPEFFWRDLLVS